MKSSIRSSIRLFLLTSASLWTCVAAGDTPIGQAPAANAAAALPGGITISNGLFRDLRLRRFTLLLETTSDWTEIQMLSDTPVATSLREVLAGRDAPELGITDSGIHKRSYDKTYVKAAYDLFVEGKPAQVMVRGTKGAIGQTTLTLETPVQAGGRSFREEKAEFAIPPERLAGGEPCDFSQPVSEPRVLTFYYPWYGSPDGPEKQTRHWDEGYTDKPQLGRFSSRAAAAIDAHLAWMRQASIDTMIVSWWGPGSYEDVTLRDYLLPRLSGGPIRLTLYLEAADNAAVLREHLSYIHDTYTGRPCFLRNKGRPVLFVYGRVNTTISLDTYRKVFEELRGQGKDFFYVADTFDGRYLEVFDGLHTYNPVGMALKDLSGIALTYQSAWLSCRKRGKLFVATALPGYDDSHLIPPRRPALVLPRENGATYRRTWEQCLASHAPWVAITTFNEWHEGSEIEPSVEYGEEYLKITAEYARVLRSAQTKKPPR